MNGPADSLLKQLSLRHLSDLVAVDSQSDERLQSLPTTKPQQLLAHKIADLHRLLGAEVERHPSADVFAAYPPRPRNRSGRRRTDGSARHRPRNHGVPHNLDVQRARDGRASAMVARAGRGSRLARSLARP